MSEKRAYFVHEIDESDWGIPVVATSNTQAKMLAFKEIELSGYYYNDLRCRSQPHANIEGLPIGVVRDDMDALRRDILHWMDDVTCDICGAPNIHAESRDGYAACHDCIEKLYYIEDLQK